MGQKVGQLKPRVGVLDARPARPAQKAVDPFYLTPEYRAWRDGVVRRAGGRCQDRDERTGERCSKAEPRHRMFADHVVERKDGGAPYDPANGMCRCGAHHSRKTADQRARRMGAALPG